MTMKTLWFLAVLVVCTRAGQLLTMTEKWKKYIVDEHNRLRVKQSASDMDEITWDSDLEEEAASWISSCKFEHKMEKHGENLAFNTDENPMNVMETAFKNWYDEIKDYRYEYKTCAPASCHYTQLVWSKTNKVGCALIKCPTLNAGFSVPDALYFGCFYSPKGNNVREYPYLRGESCSHCLKGQTCTVTGLCHGEGIKECKDKYKNPADCKMWASYQPSECNTNKPFMSQNCAKSCKFCKAPPGEEGEEEKEGPCEDVNQDQHNGKHVCQIWHDMDECDRNPDYMNYACKKTCGKCK